MWDVTIFVIQPQTQTINGSNYNYSPPDIRQHTGQSQLYIKPIFSKLSYHICMHFCVFLIENVARGKIELSTANNFLYCLLQARQKYNETMKLSCAGVSLMHHCLSLVLLTGNGFWPRDHQWAACSGCRIIQVLIIRSAPPWHWLWPEEMVGYWPQWVTILSEIQNNRWQSTVGKTWSSVTQWSLSFSSSTF